eukprot:augustus_masked-scaffold_22-processed-gene-2.47-mRNA-1 protein AED:0.44 eAED:0.44 QI:0/-1/0/1/-1/1/1/0/583
MQLENDDTSLPPSSTYSDSSVNQNPPSSSLEAIASMKLKILCMDGSSFHIEPLSSTNTVLDLKEKIALLKQIDIEVQRLIYRGKVLKNFDKLEKYSIEDNSCLHLVCRRESPSPALPRSNGSSQNLSTANQSTDRWDGENATQGLLASPPQVNTGVQAGTNTGGNNSLMVNTGAISRLLMHQIPSTNVRVAGSLSRARPRGRRPGRLGRTFAVGDNLEHVYQGFATLDTIKSAEEYAEKNNITFFKKSEERKLYRRKSDPDLSKFLSVDYLDDSTERAFCKEDIEEAKECYDDTFIPRVFTKGQWVDCRDTVNQWLDATVTDVLEGGRKVKVHYNGWGQRWDEVIDANSPRIARFRTKTKNSSNCQNFSPTIKHWVQNTPKLRAVRKSRHQLSALLPELENRMSSLINDIRKLRSNVDQTEYMDNVARVLSLSSKMDIMGRAMVDTGAALANRPHFRRRYEALNVEGSIINFFHFSMLPFGFNACFEKDRDVNGNWNRKERQELLNRANFEKDTFEMLPLAHDVSRERNQGLELHIHTIIASELGRRPPREEPQPEEQSENMALIEEVTEEMTEQIVNQTEAA